MSSQKDRDTAADETPPKASVRGPDESDESGDGFPIVGIGASAGGIDPVKQILRSLPTDTGMAFVVVQHLAPSHPSLLPEILARETPMPVSQVVDEPAVEPDHVYVIPPDRAMRVVDGRLRLQPRADHHKPRAIDVFLRSLAQDRGHKAIGVILSGTADDGTQGVETIHAEGGITFAQDETAQYSGMPASAIATGCIDYVLPPEAIAKEIARIARHPHIAAPVPVQVRAPEARPDLTRILDLIREKVGVDFRHYRRNTLQRRITRRMLLHKIDGPAAYADFLEKDRGEAEALYQDILINVTSFFRNPEAFEVLAKKVFPRLVEDRSRHEPLRIWVLGCSSGEEAYSIAMAYAEFAEAAGSHVGAQIFATDLNAKGIEKARAGLYPKSIADDVPPERLRRFFVETEGGYRIAQSIRDLCVFARHNAFTDPPFSRIDFVSCRNLLIYFEPALQQKVLSVFHYSLQPGGFVWLGNSETIGPLRDLFDVLDSGQKIYSKKPGPVRLPARLGEFKVPPGLAQTKADREREAIAVRAADIQREADRILLTKYIPPGVLVDTDMEILQFRGDTSPYLVPAPGKASLNLLKMAREGLLVGLRAAIGRAKKDEAPARETGLRVKAEGGPREVDVEVIPVRGNSVPQGCFLVVFAEPARRTHPPVSPVPDGEPPSEEAERELVRLTQELSATREYMQSVIEEQETSNEELQSANEEVQSSNEELQSINEELETSKEELQSSNEELATVNEELQNRNLELFYSNNDLTNLITSVQMPIVMLERDLRIRRFTPGAGSMLNLIAADVGRPFTDMKLPLDAPDLERAIAGVVGDGKTVERQVRDHRGRWQILRILPYRTESAIDGAVLAFFDVDDLKRAQIAVGESEERYRLLVEGAHEFAIMMLDTEGRVASWNAGAERIFGYAAPEILGSNFSRFFTPEDIAARRPEIVLRTANSQDTALNDHWMLRKDGSRLWGSGATTALRDGAGPIRGYAKVVRDMSDRKALEEDLRRRVEELAVADRSRNEFLAMLAHELRNPLAPLSNAIHLLNEPGTATEVRAEAQRMLNRHLTHMTHLLDDLLEVSRITRGKVQLRSAPVDAVALIRETVDDAKAQLETRRQAVSLSLPPSPVWLDGDAVRLHQVFGSLLDNASKFSDDGTRIDVTAERSRESNGDELVVRIRDRGIGIDAALLPRVFDLFVQADNSVSRQHGGLGIGLTLAKSLVEMHGGVLEAHSDGAGQGSEFVVRLPASLAPPSPHSDRAGARPAPPAPSPRRILLVDDNADAANTLSMLLRARGHDVRAVFSGRDCLAALNEYQPQVIILDLALPEMDGYEIAKRIRRRVGTSDIPLIALSGYGRADDRRRTREAGFAHHLLKPVKIEALQQVLASLEQQA